MAQRRVTCESSTPGMAGIRAAGANDIFGLLLARDFQGNLALALRAELAAYDNRDRHFSSPSPRALSDAF